MIRHSAFICIAMLATALFAAPAIADDAGPVYLLFANTSSQPFHVQGMTVAGKPCGTCGDRTIAPGTTVMVKIGALGSNHLKFVVKGSGNNTCNYDIAADGDSRSGVCSTSTKITDAWNVHSETIFDDHGTPNFQLIYAYDPPHGG